jgi:hypothetical protein
MATVKYLYLEKKEFAETWLNGGQIPPPALASSYLGKKRSGTKTIDETHLIEGGDPRVIIESGFIGTRNGELPIGDFEFEGNQMNGVWLPDISFSHEIEDGRILSFSNKFDVGIGQMLGKAVCIKILDMQKLKVNFDKQLNMISKMGKCKYVSNHIRNHFTKHLEDEWQDEYRIFWPLKLDVGVDYLKNKRKIELHTKPLDVPADLCEFVGEIPPISRLDFCPCNSGKRFKHCHGISL